MALTVCSICKQHIVQGTSCVHCTPSSTATLAVPLALLLGLGCQHKAPEPEVMALYGGPPVELESVAEPLNKTIDETIDETKNSTDTDQKDSTSNGTTETDSVQELSVEQKSDEAADSEIEVIEHMQALYGVPNVPNFILEPILEESKESKEENSPEDKEGVDDDEND
jgi:hypothetical protein